MGRCLKALSEDLAVREMDIHLNWPWETEATFTGEPTRDDHERVEVGREGWLYTVAFRSTSSAV